MGRTFEEAKKVIVKPKKDEVVRARVTPEIKRLVIAKADKEGKTESDYLRYIIEKEVLKP